MGDLDDEDDGGGASDGDGAGEAEDHETPAEKRVRLAKQYLDALARPAGTPCPGAAAASGGPLSQAGGEREDSRGRYRGGRQRRRGRCRCWAQLRRQPSAAGQRACASPQRRPPLALPSSYGCGPPTLAERDGQAPSACGRPGLCHRCLGGLSHAHTLTRAGGGNGDGDGGGGVRAAGRAAAGGGGCRGSGRGHVSRPRPAGHVRDSGGR
jgi:hypothetical protein